jgi:hypothetical protein
LRLQLPWQFLHLPRLVVFSHTREFSSRGEIERYDVNFGTHEVPLEDMPADSHAGSYMLSHDYSHGFRMNGVYVRAVFMVKYEYTHDDREILYDLGKLEDVPDTYTTIMC